MEVYDDRYFLDFQDKIILVAMKLRKACINIDVRSLNFTELRQLHIDTTMLNAFSEHRNL